MPHFSHYHKVSENATVDADVLELFIVGSVAKCKEAAERCMDFPKNTPSHEAEGRCYSAGFWYQKELVLLGLLPKDVKVRAEIKRAEENAKHCSQLANETPKEKSKLADDIEKAQAFAEEFLTCIRADKFAKASNALVDLWDFIHLEHTPFGVSGKEMPHAIGDYAQRVRAYIKPK